jgi:alpha-L-fucosidase 2
LSLNNVVWTTPSADARGSMPLGNGEIGLNAWMDARGDLSFYIGKTDSWEDNSRLAKVGKVRLRLAPNPIRPGAAFRQELNLPNGEIRIEADGTRIKLWVDANHPVVQLQIESDQPVKATAYVELWRTTREKLSSLECSDVMFTAKDTTTVVEPDTVLTGQTGRIGWYHHNTKSIGPDLTMKIQGLEGFPHADPILHRTFGALVKADRGRKLDDTTLESPAGKVHTFSVFVLTQHPATPPEWLAGMDRVIASVESQPLEARYAAHSQWWARFWNRSWIHITENVTAADGSLEPAGALSDAAIVSRAYALQRFISACAGRGRYPIKFNGSLFTVPMAGKPGDADYRCWGGGYWWQNSRLPYYSMCTSGDYDLMQPFFKMYVEDLLPLCLYRTKQYFGFDDAAFFSECIHFWGACFSETYGWKPAAEREDKLQDSPWTKREWVCGLELSWIMLDYYEHTQDEAFLKSRIIPFANAAMRFFDLYYKTGPDGKLVMHPAQAVETWRECTNPATEISGLLALTERLLALPAEGPASATDRAFWLSFRAKVPDLPVGVRGGDRMLIPAAKYDKKSNSETPELYGVFPFRLIAVGKPGVELGRQALANRWDRGAFGWRQDDICMAYLGLASQARDYVTRRAKRPEAKSRFPAFWGLDPWMVPDQDHGSILLKAVQSMVMQTEGRKIYVLPAWPKRWNVAFKLHAPYNTVVEGEYRDGRLERLEASPSSRRADVQILPAQADEPPPPKVAVPKLPAERFGEVFHVDLSAWVNRALADEVEGDGKGGWSDQGPDCDMRQLPTGLQTLGQVPFNILKGEKSIIVLKGAARPPGDLPAKVTIPVGRKADALFFLHSGAWVYEAESYRYVVRYADGREFPIVVGNHNLQDWIEMEPATRFADEQGSFSTVAVTVPVKQFGQGNAYRLEWHAPADCRDVEIRSIDFIGNGRCVPILLAITGVVERRPLPNP